MCKRIILILLAVAVITGCSLFPRKQAVVIEEFDSSIVDRGRIVNRDRLQEGGVLVIVPFSAGADVAATDDLEKRSLLIVKAISESILQNNVGLTLVGQEDVQTANLVLSGRITEMHVPGRMKRFLPGKDQRTFGVEGKMLDRKTGQVLLHFSHSKSSTEKNATYELLAEQIGKDIGAFVSSGVKTK